jgi:hypothetical protein
MENAMNAAPSHPWGRRLGALLVWLVAGVALMGQAFALTVSPTSVTVPVGSHASATVSNISSGATVRVSSSNTGVATASYSSSTQTVTITGVALGSATVTVRAGEEQRASIAVTVVAPLSISPTSVSVPVGGNASVSVSHATGTVTATSANTGIATVSYSASSSTAGTATIHGVAAGTTTVTLRDSYNSRTVSVTVTPVLTVSPTSVSVAVGANASVSVSNANGTVQVSSANTGIATVTYAAATSTSGTATIHGVAAGSTTVTISDSVTTRTVAVTVTSTTALTVSPTSVSVAVGGNASVSVSNANGTVQVSSANTGIATVTYAAATSTSGTATIHGVAAGSTTVTIRDSVTSRSVSVTVTSPTAAAFTVLAWNNLGMHCFDGVDYSIFSILPPFNTLLAQVIDKSGALVTSGVTVTYQATPDLSGSINTISSTKTNFWQYVTVLFFGLTPAPNVGLLGYPTPSLTPAAMGFDATNNWFQAVGIPLTNIDDAGNDNEYPMVQVVATNSSTGAVMASTKVVLPVSDELTCKACHASTTSTNPALEAAMPTEGWVFNSDPLKDFKENILRKHDELQAGNATFQAALATAGYPNGLLNSALSGKPVLCVACHVSNTYKVDAGVSTGIAGISQLTSAIHTLHGTVVDPSSGLTLDNETNRTSCYLCHPGSVTQCLRGAMSGSSYQCQSCHGNQTNVGNSARAGWLQEPNCQACHNSSQRLLSAVDANGNLLTTTDQTFATTPNVPSTGYSLFRFSTGHGGVKCEACHGSTHAEFPSTQPNDNVQSISLQGYAGTVHECTACHTTVPFTGNGGPHGMHTIGGNWVSSHEDQISALGGTGECAYCHGANFRGTFLSQVKMAKSFTTEFGTVNYTAGQAVSCYDCHNGPSGGSRDTKTQFAAAKPVPQAPAAPARPAITAPAPGLRAFLTQPHARAALPVSFQQP